jgi:hypothetical protein
MFIHSRERFACCRNETLKRFASAGFPLCSIRLPITPISSPTLHTHHLPVMPRKLPVANRRKHLPPASRPAVMAQTIFFFTSSSRNTSSNSKLFAISLSFISQPASHPPSSSVLHQCRHPFLPQNLSPRHSPPLTLATHASIACQTSRHFKSLPCSFPLPHFPLAAPPPRLSSIKSGSDCPEAILLPTSQAMLLPVPMAPQLMPRSCFACSASAAANITTTNLH